MRLVEVLVGHGGARRIGGWDAVARENADNTQFRVRVNWQGDAGRGVDGDELGADAACGSCYRAWALAWRIDKHAVCSNNGAS